MRSHGDVDPESVPIREAATVVLVRDATGRPAVDGAPPGVSTGVEVFLQHRVSSMTFAPDMTVFPGGGVEERDRRDSSVWHGPGPELWAADFQVEPARAESAVRAAVRELFEETGVLLARSSTASTETAGRPGPEDRAALDAGRCSLDDVLAAYELCLDASLLRPFDRWTTPVGPPRRYDTLFFLAAAPPGAEPDGATSEARSAGWMRADAAASAGRSGELGVLPPTAAALDVVAAAGSVSELICRAPGIAPGGHRP